MAEPSDPRMPTEIAYTALLPEIMAVPDDEALQINVDVMSAVTLVLGVLPELRALRSQIVHDLIHFDIERFDKLEQYALALSHADTRHRNTFPNKAAIAQLGDELALVRDRLYGNAASLASFGLIDAQHLQNCKKESGYQAVARDILTLCDAFRQSWKAVEGKSPVTLQTLSDAGRRALELLSAVGVREQGPISTSEASLLRQKAFRLFVDAYEDATRAIHYLRYKHRDADDIVPSLWAARGRRRESEREEPETPAPATPSAMAKETAEPALPVMENPLGLPVTPPFVNN